MGSCVVMAVCVLVASVWGVEATARLGVGVGDGASCSGDAAPALFVFGASYMDVGENFAAMPFRSNSDFLPYGVDFVGGPSGRFSNGRLIIDHISEALGQGHLSPYLKTVGANFRHGVNFASSGSKACNSSITGDGSESSGLFSLSVQVDQFRVFRHQTLSMFKVKKKVHGLLPPPEAFSSGVYIIEAGGNDFHNVPHEEFAAMSSLVLSSIEQAIRGLYNEGARTFVVMEGYPAECYPITLQSVAKEELNEDGCEAEGAEDREYHNSQLGKMLAALNVELVGANLILFQLHDVIMDGIRNPSKYGLKYVHRACCGVGGGEYNCNGKIGCGGEGMVDGEWQKATVCENRAEYMMWDGIHTTDTFNFHIAQALVRGEFMEPSFFIKEMCRHEKQ